MLKFTVLIIVNVNLALEKDQPLKGIKSGMWKWVHTTYNKGMLNKISLAYLLRSLKDISDVFSSALQNERWKVQIDGE